MKIIVYYEQTGYGGVDTHLAHLINNWSNKDDHFTVVSNPDNEGLKFLEQKLNNPSVSIKTLDKVFSRPSISASKLTKMLNYLTVQLKFIGAFNKILKELSPDIVLSNNGGFPGGMTTWLATIIAKRRNNIQNNTFLLVHHAPTASVVTPFTILSNLLIRWIIYLNIPVITVSQASKQLLESFTSLKNINVIYNGLELNKKINIPYDFKKKCEIEKSKKIIGIIGPVDPHKGHSTILEVFRQSDYLKQQAHFVIVGSGKALLVENLNNRVKEYGLDSKVTFTGFLAEDSSQIIAGFDILVMPTIDFEGFGYSMAEAMSLKVPVVASKVGAIPEVIADGLSGLLVDPKDMSSWQKMLEKMVEDDALCKKIGTAAYERIEKNFTAEKMSKNYYDIMVNP